jgi:hypothetical protein
MNRIEVGKLHYFHQSIHNEGQSFESMVKLLNSPTLRELKFKYVDFTNLLCQAVAKALQERSEITNMHFDGYCSFPGAEVP